MSTDAYIATAGVVTTIAGGVVYAWNQGWIPSITPVSSDPMYTLYLPAGLIAGGLIAMLYSLNKQ